MFSPHAEHYSKELSALIDKAQRSRWSPDEQIDWSQRIEVPQGLALPVYIDMVSQLYYAEEATLQVLARFIKELPELQAKLFICTQAADEARHAETYRRYLEKLGGIAPIEGKLRALFDKALAYTGPVHALVVALNIIMEHEALRQQKHRIAQLPCPLFRQINCLIVEDEARHTAFGTIYLKHALTTLDRQAKQQIFQFIAGLWDGWIDANRGRYEDPAASSLRVQQSEFAQRWQNLQQTLRHIGLVEET